MKQITLKVPDNKLTFFLELIKNLDFVQVDERFDSRDEILNNIKEGLKEAKKAKAGKLQTTPAVDFLNEI